MQYVDGRLVLSPTDLTKHLACPHITTLDAAVALGRLTRPADGIDEQLRLVFAKGLEHEYAYLERLRAEGRSIREISTDHTAAGFGSGAPDASVSGPEAAEAATIQAMRDGVEVIYQGCFYDGQWVGYADFLLRVERPSLLGDYSYDIADTKLARRLKVPALLQMATYAERLQQIQGVPPQQLIVVTGDREERPWRHLDVAAYAGRARELLRDFAESFTGSLTDAAGTDDGPGSLGVPVTEPVPNPYCSQCRWLTRCSAEWEAADDLSLVAGMRTGTRAALRESGIRTLTELAGADPEQLGALTPSARERLHRQARLQELERRIGQPAYELLAPAPAQGLQRLPRPDRGDVYLDFEGDPFANDGVGLEYLAGLLSRLDPATGRPVGGGAEFTTWWAHDQAAEAEMVLALLDHLVQRWRDFPDMHIYHYAAYETVALKRLTSRYGVGEEQLDMLLRGERFVDLYPVVKQGVAISKGSYSIKKLESFYWGHTRTAEGDQVADGLSSVVEYERWIVDRDQSILDRIAAYNREDVRSTRDLQGWLEGLRAELVDAGHTLHRPGESALEEARDSEAIAAEKALAADLEDADHPLFAGLVGWHRREDRPEWWEFFRRADLSDDELVDDAATLGKLESPEHVDSILGRSGRVTSHIWRYPMPPQLTVLGAGDAVVDVDTREGAGTIAGLDLEDGWVEVKRGVSKDPAPARAFGPSGPLNNAVLRESVARSARGVLAGAPSVSGALVERLVPRALTAPADGEEDPVGAVRRVGAALTGADAGRVLAVQGPPGAGKTYAAAHLIRDLLDAGYRVGVTALSHAVIRNLLHAVDRPAVHKYGVGPAGEVGGGDRKVMLLGNNDDVAAALQSGEANLVGGTAWMWAREQFADAVDVLVVDEAGQFSLANAVAVAPAGRAMVLLGDPQQLTQPTKSEHPHGAQVSALAHLIGDHAVIPPDRGLFLDRTWRMHPELTALVSDLSYDSKLAAAPGRSALAVDVPGHPEVTGSGVRWYPVMHEGRVDTSPEEVDAVADLVTAALRGTWIDADGVRRSLTPADVLVVAPYNAHVDALTEGLAQVLADGHPAVVGEGGAGGVAVGTVDKFQGREAALVIYALGSSSALDAPRGVNFLFDVHRLNVAISRAKALTVVVGSPGLLYSPVRDPEQLRAVNALCELVARAERATLGAAAASDTDATRDTDAISASGATVDAGPAPSSQIELLPTSHPAPTAES